MENNAAPDQGIRDSGRAPKVVYPSGWRFRAADIFVNDSKKLTDK